MKTNSLFAVIFLSVLFLLDIVKPFAYYLHAEFLLLGVIAGAFMFPFAVALSGSIIAGVAFDCLSWPSPMRSVEFPLCVLCIRYILVNFKSVFARRAAGVLCLLAHIVLVSLQTQRFFLLYSVSFFLQSLLLFFLLYYMLKQWAIRLSVDSI